MSMSSTLFHASPCENDGPEIEDDGHKDTLLVHSSTMPEPQRWT